MGPAVSVKERKGCRILAKFLHVQHHDKFDATSDEEFSQLPELEIAADAHEGYVTVLIDTDNF